MLLCAVLAWSNILKSAADGAGGGGVLGGLGGVPSVLDSVLLRLLRRTPVDAVDPAAADAGAVDTVGAVNLPALHHDRNCWSFLTPPLPVPSQCPYPCHPSCL